MQSVAIPLWSVSVEEQFYLLWPLVVRKANRKRMVAICVLLIGAAFLWARGRDANGRASPDPLGGHI